MRGAAIETTVDAWAIERAAALNPDQLFDKSASPGTRLAQVGPLLSDPVRAVRIEAGKPFPIEDKDLVGCAP